MRIEFGYSDSRYDLSLRWNPAASHESSRGSNCSKGCLYTLDIYRTTLLALRTFGVTSRSRNITTGVTPTFYVKCNTYGQCQFQGNCYWSLVNPTSTNIPICDYIPLQITPIELFPSRNANKRIPQRDTSMTLLHYS